MEQHVLSITQVNEYIRVMMDSDRLLSGIAVKGEISNYKVYPSGHHYFTLKDDNASLRCVMFRTSSMRLKFKPANGMKIIAMGKISVYPRDGAYQLVCSTMALDGVGDLYAAFEQLKNKLAAQGLFDSGKKQSLPKYPKTIGIITSSAGAAIHDMLRILRKRYPLTLVRLLPVRVQGAEAPAEIAAAIRFANAHNLADLLIVGRGGGSIEDLWAFNEEIVAYAIFQSKIPVISAVGHEPDVTISDFVADQRAATPSNAAEISVPDQYALRQTLDSCRDSMAASLSKQLTSARRHLAVLADSQVLNDPALYLRKKRLEIDNIRHRIANAQKLNLNLQKQRFVSLTAKLDAMSPLKVLTRGYAMMQLEDDTIVRSVSQLQPDEQVKIQVSDGSVSAQIIQIKENHHEYE